jgi:hypothetical protein
MNRGSRPGLDNIGYNHSCNKGWRGAELAKELRGVEYEVSDDEFKLLYEACVHHTRGRNHPEVTVRTCRDADRLDLGRVGIEPRRKYPFSKTAKDPRPLTGPWSESKRSICLNSYPSNGRLGLEYLNFSVPHSSIPAFSVLVLDPIKPCSVHRL